MLHALPNLSHVNALHLVWSAGQICKAGRCQCVSPKEIMCASGTCVDIKSDNNNCGACGAMCTAGESSCYINKTLCECF
jgi:hypothetical protein